MAAVLKNDKATDTANRWLKESILNNRELDMTNNTLIARDNQTHTSPKSLHSACLHQMEENGLGLDKDFIPDGRIRRYSIDRKKTQPDEWYVAHEGVFDEGIPYLVCIYGSWSEDSKFEFKSWEMQEFRANVNEKERRKLDEFIRKKRKEAEKALEEERKEAAKKAENVWKNALLVHANERQIAYTKKKGIEPLGGVRFGRNQQGHASIIIPVQNISGELKSLQFISVGSDGKTYKGFFSGGEIKGNFFPIGEIINGEALYIAEGYATGVSIHQATNSPVIVAFGSGNISNVTQQLRKKYLEKEIILAPDNDQSGVGQKKAEEAAKLYNCKVVMPSFQKGKDLDENGKLLTDFNDLHTSAGIEEVRKQLKSTKKIQSIQEEMMEIASSLLQKEEPCEGFSTSILPKCLHEYISSIAETTNADPIMITCSVLATISSFVKRKAYIKEDDYFQTLYPNLWMLNITKSGGFKTTALNKGAKLAWKKAEETHKKIKEFEEKLKNAKPDEKEDLEAQKLLTSIDNPILPGKITSEALMEHLGLGHGGMILTSEFGAWLQNLEKSHNSDLKQIFTDLYDVPSFFHYKTKTSGDHLIEKPFLSICGVSTLTWIKENLKHNDVSSGFFARFLLFTPPNNDDIPPARPIKSSTHNLKAEYKIIDTLHYMDESYEYKFTPSSGDYFDDLHNSIYQIPKQYSEGCQEILDPYLKRWSPYLLKIAMLIRLFEKPTSKEISDTSLASAMEILKVAIKSTAKLFEGELGESEQQRKFRMVFEWICKRAKKGKQSKYGDILTSRVLPGGSKEYDNVLEYLVNAGKINKIEKHPKKETLYVPEKVEKVEKG